jgi:hypothetical protein
LYVSPGAFTPSRAFRGQSQAGLDFFLDLVRKGCLLAAIKSNCGDQASCRNQRKRLALDFGRLEEVKGKEALEDVFATVACVSTLVVN